MNQKQPKPTHGEFDIDAPKTRRPKRSQPEIIRDMALVWAVGDRVKAKEWILRRIDDCEKELLDRQNEVAKKKAALISAGRVQLAASIYDPRPSKAHKDAIDALDLV